MIVGMQIISSYADRNAKLSTVSYRDGIENINTDL